MQTCGRALTSLKYFYEEVPEYNTIATWCCNPTRNIFSSGEGGIFDALSYEFLLAQNEFLAKEILKCSVRDDMWNRFSLTLLEKYRDYQITGGMPEVVQSWIVDQSIDNVEKIQSQIIKSYENDFAKYAPISYFPKLSAVWNSIPSQLAKENRKFIFSQVKKGWRAKDLEDALEWLIRAGLVYKVENVEKPNFPIKAYANHAFFKLYISDIGLLRRMSNLPTSVLFDMTNNYKEFKGAITENFVCCELMKIYDNSPYYWTAEAPERAEVDFIVQDDK